MKRSSNSPVDISTLSRPLRKDFHNESHCCFFRPWVGKYGPGMSGTRMLGQNIHRPLSRRRAGRLMSGRVFFFINLEHVRDSNSGEIVNHVHCIHKISRLTDLGQEGRRHPLPDVSRCLLGNNSVIVVTSIHLHHLLCRFQVNIIRGVI